MADQIPIPLQIEKQSEQEMKIVWSTGETTIALFTELRFRCLCAECVDEWTRERRLKREAVSPNIKPTRVEPVGRYAIQIDWTDGHRTGIYTYSQLYEISKSARL